jgi:hypothetical protein
MAKKKPIDKVTVQRLDLALRMVHIEIHTEILDRIIDVVELIEDKGGKVSIKDMVKLRTLWESN